MTRVHPASGAALGLLLGLAGCDLPRDRAGTLERLRQGGEARIGVAHNPPWTFAEGGRAGGVETRLAAEWARSVGGRPRLIAGPENELVERLRRGEIDVLVAGLEKDTPHAKALAPTQVYLKTAAAADRPGKTAGHVMAVRQGESATLHALDGYLLKLDRGALERELAR